MIALLLGACAAPRLTMTDHALAGRLWDPAARRFIDAGDVAARVAASDLVLVGETHDNPAHHEIQLDLLKQAAGARRVALALEPLDAEWQAAIDAARESPDAMARAARVAKSWDWDRHYAPIVSYALEKGLRIVAANLSRERAREVGAKGFESLGGEAARLAVEPPWDAQRNATLRAILVEAHCGKDYPHIDGMVLSQRARDAVMADRLLAAKEPVVAIVGRGHARRDFGVPIYLAHRAPGVRVLSIGLVEVRDGDTRPQDYDEAAPGVHDLVWFTPRAPRDEPC
jgi:uncharacterized iron-regulated protein